MDIREPAQLALLERLRPPVGGIDYPADAPAEPGRFYYMNGVFPVLDAELLYGALDLFKPRRIVEVGSLLFVDSTTTGRWCGWRITCSAARATR
ncbi:MAG: hypothetical protein KF740_05420 [Ramlibacter sp.]|nr:hypothetical protein [Ramlibacter sp.]